MYIKSRFEITTFFRYLFNKYKLTFMKRSLHHFVGNLIIYNFSFYLLLYLAWLLTTNGRDHL